MKEHPRSEVCRTAKLELLQFIIDWRKKHELTLSEELQSLSEQLNDSLKSSVHAERQKGRAK